MKHVSCDRCSLPMGAGPYAPQHVQLVVVEPTKQDIRRDLCAACRRSLETWWSDPKENRTGNSIIEGVFTLPMKKGAP